MRSRDDFKSLKNGIPVGTSTSKEVLNTAVGHLLATLWDSHTRDVHYPEGWLMRDS